MWVMSRIGVAVSDPLGIIASPYSVITRTELGKDLEAVATIVTDREAIAVVAGIPLDREGKPGPQAQKVLEFIEQLRGVVSVEIATQDERFSTAAANRMLIEANVSRKGRKKVVDKVAATTFSKRISTGANGRTLSRTPTSPQ